MPPTLCTANAAGGSLGPAPWLLVCFFGANRSSVHNFVDCGFLVPGASDDELVVGWNVAAENRRRLLRLSKKTETTSSVNQNAEIHSCYLKVLLCPQITLWYLKKMSREMKKLVLFLKLWQLNCFQTRDQNFSSDQAACLALNSGVLPEICWIHKVSSMHSGGYLCLCSRTIYLQEKTHTAISR